MATNRILQFAFRLAMACLLVMVSGGMARLALTPVADGPTPGGEAVTSLTEGKYPSDSPPGFERAMGYTPDASGRPDGSCSVPAGLAYPGFADACRVHDFGYDLLRYADETGDPLGPWARLAIDRLFHEHMVDSCETLGCLVLAHVYSFVVGVNTLRQGFTTPVEEPAGLLVVVGIQAVVTILALPTPSGHLPRRHPGSAQLSMERKLRERLVISWAAGWS